MISWNAKVLARIIYIKVTLMIPANLCVTWMSLPYALVMYLMWVPFSSVVKKYILLHGNHITKNESIQMSHLWLAQCGSCKCDATHTHMLAKRERNKVNMIETEWFTVQSTNQIDSFTLNDSL